MAGGPSGSQAGADGGLTKGARITGDQRSSLAKVFGERYSGGESIRSIAEDSGRSYGFVHGVLKESGASLRGRGGATRGARSGPLDKVSDQVGVAAGAATESPARTSAKAGGAKSSRVKAGDKAGDKVGDKAVAKPGRAKAAKDERPKKKAEAKKPAKKGKKG